MKSNKPGLSLTQLLASFFDRYSVQSDEPGLPPSFRVRKSTCEEGNFTLSPRIELRQVLDIQEILC